MKFQSKSSACLMIHAVDYAKTLLLEHPALLGGMSKSEKANQCLSSLSLYHR